MSKQETWSIKIRRDQYTIRRNFFGFQKPDGYEGEVFEGKTHMGYVFGLTEAEVRAKALDRKQSVLDERANRACTKVVEL